MTPVLPGTIWRFLNGKEVFILDSCVIDKDLWEIEMVDAGNEITILEVKMEDWLRDAVIVE